MIKKYVGGNRAENLDWLANVWLTNGPPVCFLQGFPGVGKTDLARDLLTTSEMQRCWQQAVINEITDRPTPSVIESLMELSATISRQGLPEMEAVLFGELNPNLAFALEKALQRPVIIILDEAQRFFKADSGSPLAEMNGILSFLRNRPNLPGRLLLLSDRLVENAKWSEWIPKRTLTKLEPEEAIEALEDKLKASVVTLDVSLERKQDLVKALDYNPRAIEALVGALVYDSLDEIIGSNPGLWDTEDRVVSREFLDALERDLLERTLKHLDMTHQKKLWRLAVHRRSFKLEALERICGSKDEAATLRTILVTRYLINFRSGALSLNPIVREISLSHLKEEPAECKQAHSGAANYHLRHFKAKKMVGSQTTLGESFAEVRYHLVQAGREAEIREIGHRFTDHLKAEIKSISPVPKDMEELDERIGVLTVLLEGGGAKGLEYHLARCLQTRGKPGDIERAIIHAKRATGTGASEVSWMMLAKLKHQAEGVDSAIRTIRSALRKMAEPDVASPLYQLGAEILSEVSKTEEAVALLKEGIKVIPADKNLFSLYKSCADLLGPAGKTEEAVALLKEGIKVIPADKGLFSLYKSCADLLGRAGKTEEAVALLKEGIKVIPADKNLISLYLSCADLLGRAGKTEEAVALLKEGIKVIPADKNLISLYQNLGEVFCRAGKPSEAITVQLEAMHRIPEQFGRHKVAEGALLLSVATGDSVQLAKILSENGVAVLSRRQLMLGKVLECQDHGDWAAAAELAKTARVEFPLYLPLAAQEAFCRLAVGDAEGANRSLSEFPNLVFGTGEPHGWLIAFIHLRRGARSEASAALSEYLGRPVDESRELNETFLLRLWDQQEVSPRSSRLCFHFPILPESLTGLKQTIRRVQFTKQVLPSQVTSTPVVNFPAASLARTATPEIYVSYAWGEDSTEPGCRHEEIVDRLCAAVEASGRVIGRDKDRMRGGDSIERFAHEISKAKRIVAVISQKSLHSEFCMAHELFRAFRRCDYQREEFQKKVIALVMDDAKPLLKDNLSIVALAKVWQERLEKLRAELQSVDPTRKSADLWVFVDTMEEMCPRLPAMLGALKDIVMKRGFEEIVKDGFQEVISLLPHREET
jgi:tetratricopeptide (TPR) repeat protein